MSTILVTGANRGLGLEFVRRYGAAGARVIAACRFPHDAHELRAAAASGPVAVEELDVTDPRSVSTLADKYRGVPVDILLNNAGFLGPDPIADNFSRQYFGQMDYELWADIVRVNVFGAVRMAEAFVDHVARSREKKIVCLSSGVGSIESRRTPTVAYPSSKAALNKAVSLAAHHLKDRGVICAAVCPGHVKTRMGVGGAELEIEDSVKGLIRVIENLTLADTGTFTRYDGARIPW